jgi:hypothetical protein
LPHLALYHLDSFRSRLLRLTLHQRDNLFVL